MRTRLRPYTSWWVSRCGTAAARNLWWGLTCEFRLLGPGLWGVRQSLVSLGRHTTKREIPQVVYISLKGKDRTRYSEYVAHNIVANGVFCCMTCFRTWLTATQGDVYSIKMNLHVANSTFRFLLFCSNTTVLDMYKGFHQPTDFMP